jgi:predicted metal-binding membrane protein
MSALLRVDVHRRRSYATAAGLVLLAWLALAVWSTSPYAEWVDHARVDEIAAPPIVRLVVFILGWTLMIIAMMLPGTLLLLARCLENKPFGARRVAPVILAYVAVWTVYGSFIYLSDGVLHEMIEQAPTLAGLVAPAVLLSAGVYQFTPMKRLYLSRCYIDGTVFKALGQSSHCNLWALGLRHGVYCLGSCWALMLLMFVIGGINLISMLTLGALMTVERLSKRGEGVAQYLGIVIIIASVLLVLA